MLPPKASPWSVLQREAMLTTMLSMLHVVSTNHVLSLWSVLLLTVKDMEAIFCYGIDDFRLTAEKEGHGRLL